MPFRKGDAPWNKGIIRVPKVVQLERHREMHRKWYQSHREEVIKKSRKWHQLHREQQREAVRKHYWLHHEQELERLRRWRNANHEKALEARNRWARNHQEQLMQYNREWNQTHRDQINQMHKKWEIAHPLEWKSIRAKVYSRRKRELPTNHVIGTSRKGFVLHHMTPEIAIWIPDGLHRSSPHSLSNPESMTQINRLAMEWASSSQKTIFQQIVSRNTQ